MSAPLININLRDRILQLNHPMSPGTSLVPLIGALLLSACGGGQTDRGVDAMVQPLDADEARQFVEAESPGPVGETFTHSENFFEKSEWTGSSFDGLHNNIECESSISRSTAVSRKGESSVRFQVGLKDILCPEDRYRAEVSVANGSKQDYPWDDPKVHWVGLSIYPRKFDKPAYSFLQIHAPNEKGKCDYAGNAVSIKPVEISGKMHYALQVILDGSKVRQRTGAFTGTTRVWSEPMKMTGFTDFVISFTLSTKKQGTVKLWRNGELVYSGSGLTNVNYIDSCGNPIPSDYRAHTGPHAGIYGPPAQGGEKEQDTYGNPYREVFIDQMRTASGTDGYAAVDPSR